ncbi:MAG: hypothetical protein U5K29_15805 [Acidimicrobiales bacterium]|nr:hypothetical protein [Acidimicrobiales bacterium]
MNGTGPVADARAAVDRGEWLDALRLLDAGGDAAASPEAIELRATAAYGAGDFDACIRAWEELHGLHEAAGDRAEAARAAAMLAMYLMMDTGLMAPVRGWLRRAERLVEGHDEVTAHAFIAMTRTYERFMCGDMAAAEEQAALAIELGERLGVVPAVVIGRVAMARVRIFNHQVDEGLELLDEVCAHLMSGEVDALTTGMMYCELICAAQGLALLDRATEWTDVMERWRHGVAFGGINGRCRVHRAELLRMSGPCDAAEAEALGACEELRPWMRREYGWPLVELGNIRLRKGDLDGAEEAFLAAHDRAWSPQPGLALLRLEQGEVTTASALIAEAIAHPVDIPWKERPPFGDLQLAPLLDAQVEIAAAAGDVDTARQAAAALQRTADSYSSRGLAASASLAGARAALADNDLDDAVHRASEAVAMWTELGAPFDAAVARTVLADACQRSGNLESATMHRRTARAAFEAFGAARRVDRLDDLLTAERSPAQTGDADAAVATFRLDGDMRTVAFAGRTTLVRDLKGFRYLARMLAEPDREFHVLDLVAAEQGNSTAHQPSDDDDLRPSTGAGLPVIDDEAREAYRRRLAEVDEDIDEARRLNDTGRIALAERDREFLVAELAAAVGLGGRARTVGGDAERARTSVARTIRYSLRQLAEHHPDAAAHLEQRVRTGTYCSYRSDPVARLTWEL